MTRETRIVWGMLLLKTINKLQSNNLTNWSCFDTLWITAYRISDLQLDWARYNQRSLLLWLNEVETVEQIQQLRQQLQLMDIN